jgi:hypothetical protein
MSGWNPADRMMEENTGDEFPAVNNITVAGYLPSDQVPAPSKFANLTNHNS